jgi:glycogen debranching enzyme
VLLNGNTHIVSNITADGFGAASFEESGDIVEHLRDGRLPDQMKVQNDLGLASGALQYDVALVPDDTWEVSLRVGAETDAAWTPLEVAAEYWRKRLQRIGEKVQDPYLKKILMTVVANILMNRDGPAFQQGPRFYARAWIRDAATMIRVLLLLGFKEEAREFIVWYAQYNIRVRTEMFPPLLTPMSIRTFQTGLKSTIAMASSSTRSWSTSELLAI